MGDLKHRFQISISSDFMLAELFCNRVEELDTYISKGTFLEFLHSLDIKEGIYDETIDALLEKKNFRETDFPLTIAKGRKAENGKDGILELNLDLDTNIEKTDELNFREIMRIPSVQKGQRLARIVPATEGTDGLDVMGRKIKAKPGQPISNKVGKNVVFNESDLSFYSAIDGQISISNRLISVHGVYEVTETLSMKTGNLNFVGSIIIHGDIPSGFTVKAGGDIKVFGIVEAATVVSSGSVYISEGIAGLNKGSVTAKENVHVGYSNQGNIYAGDSIYTDNSITHSECSAKNNVICKQGNITGGTISAGNLVESWDIGNRLSTKTNITFGLNKSIYDEGEKYIVKKRDLEQTLQKLKLLGEKLNRNPATKTNPKHRITMLRQKNSYNKTKKALEEVDNYLHEINTFIRDENGAKLIVKGTIFPSVTITFGKYKQVMKENRQKIEMSINQNEIIMRGLSV